MFQKANLVLLLLIITVLFKTSSANAADNPYLATLPQWQQTLEKFVDDEGRIDFRAIYKQPNDLKAFVDAIAAVSPDSNPELFPNREAVLAYHMNAYNALAMWGVIERDIPKNFSSFIKRASFFKLRSVVIGGKKTNLYDYENKVIRPLDEPRTHFALNCMVKDCPRLLKQAFTAETLDKDLQAVSVEFFSKERHIRFDDEAKNIYLSSILKFYTKDFTPNGDKQDLIAYVNQFTSKKVPEDYRVKFIKYDWTVNQQPTG